MQKHESFSGWLMTFWWVWVPPIVNILLYKLGMVYSNGTFTQTMYIQALAGGFPAIISLFARIRRSVTPHALVLKASFFGALAWTIGAPFPLAGGVLGLPFGTNNGAVAWVTLAVSLGYSTWNILFWGPVWLSDDIWRVQWAKWFGVKKQLSASGAHGFADWMDEAEQSKLFASDAGLILGVPLKTGARGWVSNKCADDGLLNDKPTRIDEGRGVNNLFGPSGSGKGAGYILPNLYNGSSNNADTEHFKAQPTAIVAFDPKGELTAMTWVRRVEMGQRVVAFDPFGVLSKGKYTSDKCKYHYDREWFFNPLDSVRSVECDRKGNPIYDTFEFVQLDDAGNVVMDNSVTPAQPRKFKWPVARCNKLMRFDLKTVGESLYPPGKEVNPHFQTAANILFIGFSSWVLTSKWRTKETVKSDNGQVSSTKLIGFLPGERTLTTVQQMLTMDPKGLEDWCDFVLSPCNAKVAGGLAIIAARLYKSAAEEERGSIVTTTLMGLDWIDAAMSEQTSRSGCVVFDRDAEGNTLIEECDVIDDDGNVLRKPIRAMRQVSKRLPRLDSHGNHLWDSNGDLVLDEHETIVDEEVFEPFSMREIARGKTDIFLVIDDEAMKQYAAWMRIMLNAVMRVATTASLDRKIDVILDELGQAGRIVLVENAIGICSSKGIRMSLVWQDNGMAAAIYGAERLQSMEANSLVRIYLAINDSKTAEAISKELGKTTIKLQSTSVSGTGTGAASRSVSTQDVASELASITELKTLPSDNAVIFPRGKRPILIKTIRYYNHALFRRNDGSEMYPPVNPYDQARISEYKLQGGHFAD